MKTQWSQVTHYYFEDCAYYAPMMSDPFYGNIAFRSVADVITGAPVGNKHLGEEIPANFLEVTRGKAGAVIAQHPRLF